MKVAIWLGEKSEALYDSITDEVIFREVNSKNPRVTEEVRIRWSSILAARIRAHNGEPDISTGFPRMEAPTIPATRSRRKRTGPG